MTLVTKKKRTTILEIKKTNKIMQIKTEITLQENNFMLKKL